MNRLWLSGCAALTLAACAPANNEAEGPDLAADTANPPQTDIFVASMDFGDEGLVLRDLLNVTNAPGYDNQPSFIPGTHEFYFVSENATGKTDIWVFDLVSKQQRLFHDSPTISEYSPKTAPADFGVSYIQENEAGDVTRVHFAPETGGPGEAAIDFAPLGYYAWLAGGEKLGVFLRSEPPALHLVDVESDQSEAIADNIGRSFHATPDGQGLFFTAIDPDEIHQVMFFDLRTRAVSNVVGLPVDVQDFVVVFSDTGELAGLMAGNGSTLMFNALENTAPQWQVVGDYAVDGLHNITRIAISDDHAYIALVGEIE